MHIHPDEELNLSSEWRDLPEAELSRKVREAMPLTFCGRSEGETVNERLVRPGRDYCPACLEVYRQRRSGEIIDAGDIG